MRRSMSGGSTADATMMTESAPGNVFAAIEKLKASLVEDDEAQHISVEHEHSIGLHKASFKSALNRLERCIKVSPNFDNGGLDCSVFSVPDGGDTSVGNTDAIALSNRRKLNKLGSEVHAAHGLGIWRAMNTSQDQYLATQGLLTSAIRDSVVALLAEMPGGLMTETAPSSTSSPNLNPGILVWPDAYLARQSVVRHALASRYGSCKKTPISATMAGAPLVILVEEHDDMSRLNAESGELESQSRSFQEWQAATLGMAILTTVLVDSHEQAGVALDAHLSRETARANLSPVLVVLRIESNSTMSAGILDLRSVCDFHNAHIHLEGPGLCAVSQAKESPQRAQTLEAVQSFSLDPAAWFGIQSCAIATLHQNGVDLRNEHDIPGLDCLSGPSLGPIAGLWMFLTRMGLLQIRSLVSDAIQLSDDFVDAISSVPNLETVRCGFGSTLKISYVMSRSDRLLRKYKAKEQVSKINKSVFCDAKEQCSALRMTLCHQNGRDWIVFSPPKLLASGTLWTPGVEQVHQVVDKMILATSKYEMSVVGSPAFAHKFGGLVDFQMVDESEAGLMHMFCYGAFRIVPEELSRNWREYPEDVDIVCQLTANMASTLANKLGEIRLSLSSKHRSRSNTRIPAVPGNYKANKSKTRSGPEDLPFEFFLHADNDNGAPDFLTVEVRELREPTHAVQEASLAADVVLSAAESVCNEWRKSIGAAIRPSSLANVRGLDCFAQKNQNSFAARSSLPREQLPLREQGTTKSPAEDKYSKMSSEDDYESAEDEYAPFHNIARPDKKADILRSQEDGAALARSHIFGGGSTRESSERSRKGRQSRSNKKSSGKGRDESSEDDQSSNDSRETYNRRGGDRGRDSDKSDDSEKSGGSESGSNRADGSESDPEASDGSESDDEGEVDTAPPTPRRGLMGWLRGDATEESASKNQRSGSRLKARDSGSESESSEGGKPRRRHDGYSTHSDDSDSQVYASKADRSDSEYVSEKEEMDQDESDGEFDKNEKLVSNASPQSTTRRFGFNWLSQKVLPEQAGVRGGASDAESAYSHNTSRSSARSVSLQSEDSDYESEPDRMNTRSSKLARASSKKSYYSSESARDESRSESDDSEDRSRAYSRRSGGSRRSHDSRISGGRHVAESAAPKRTGVLEWITGVRATEPPQEKKHARRPSSNGSFSSSSSERNEDESDRGALQRERDTQKTRTRRPREESRSSGSVLSWFSGKPAEKQTTRAPKRGSGGRPSDRGNSAHARRTRR